MSISDIDREAVLKAINEFNRLDRQPFLEKYRFNPSQTYYLNYEGRLYDSKPILGVAHGYARPDVGPLRPSQFNGGLAKVVKKLRALQFDVEPLNEPQPNRRAFLLTWKANGWPHDNLVRMHAAFLANGYVDEPWRIQAHRQAAAGDLVWVLKQGMGPKGIFGQGSILGTPFLGDIGRDKQQWLSNVRFTALVDPMEEFLVDEAATRTVLTSAQMRSQASGISLTSDQSAKFELLTLGTIRRPALIAAATADDDPFDPTNVKDARARIRRSIAVRRGQTAFRNGLIAAYEGRCAITGCDVLDVLEAAHIFPYRGPETNRTSNGLLLRADIHTLFDCDLIAINPGKLSVIVSRRLDGSDYASLNGTALRSTTRTADSPSREALALRVVASPSTLSRWPFP